MAVKKKTARKAPRKKTSGKTKPAIIAEPTNSLLDPAHVGDAIETLQRAVEAYREGMSELEDDAELSQDMIAVAAFAQRGKDALADITKLFEVNALRLRPKGSFVDGPFRVEFEIVKGKRSPKWKELAVDSKRALCKQLNESFDADQYEDLVKANTKPKDDKTKAVIREVG